MPVPRPPLELPDDHLVLTDPRALRALAHPARTAVVDDLYQGNVRTSSQLAAITGLSASAMSYHLRALEKWGIVRRATSAEHQRDARERPWERAARGLSWAGHDAGSAASDTLLGIYLGRLARDLAAWRRVEPPDPEDPWSDASTVNRGFPWMTADELDALNRSVQKLIDPFVGRSAASHPDGARRVAFFFASAPVVEGADEGVGEVDDEDAATGEA